MANWRACSFGSVATYKDGGFFLKKFCPNPLPAGVNELWTINLLKNEPFQTTSVTKLLCDYW